MANRNKDYKVGSGRMSENRVAWAETILGRMIVRQYPPGQSEMNNRLDDIAEGELGSAVRLEIFTPGKSYPTGFNLTTCTLPELKAIRELINFAIDLAEPVVTFRDGMAQHAAQQGDDSFTRVYRQVPVLVVREGKVRAHDEGVLLGSSDVPQGPGGGDPDGGHGGGVRGTGGILADEESSGAGAEDIGQEADEPA